MIATAKMAATMEHMLHLLCQFAFRVIFLMLHIPVSECCNKILLSLPINNYSAERSMSRMKLIKSRLRFTITDGWMNGFVLMSAEKRSDIYHSMVANGISTIYCLKTEIHKSALKIDCRSTGSTLGRTSDSMCLNDSSKAN